jgi:hypothetical protein
VSLYFQFVSIITFTSFTTTMTARLRGAVQYEKASIAVAIHIITSAFPPAGEVKHESEQGADEGGKTQGSYPAATEEKKT